MQPYHFSLFSQWQDFYFYYYINIFNERPLHSPKYFNNSKNCLHIYLSVSYPTTAATRLSYDVPHLPRPVPRPPAPCVSFLCPNTRYDPVGPLG